MHVEFIILITTLLCTTCYGNGLYLNMEEIPAMKLSRNLSTHYVKQVPVVNYKDTLQVEVFMRLFQLLELDSSSETMAVTGELIFIWKDSFLKWSLDDFPDVTVLSIPANEIWVPDLSIVNSAGAVRYRDWRDDTNVMVSYHGTVVYIIRSQFKVTCDFDMSCFPADVQTCSILLALQTYPRQRVNLTYPDEHTDIDITMYDEDGEWDLIDSSVTSVSDILPVPHSILHVPYSGLSFSLTYRRLVSGFSSCSCFLISS